MSVISLVFFLVTISTSTYFDGLLVTGLYTSTTVQSAPIPAPAAFGFGKSPITSTAPGALAKPSRPHPYCCSAEIPPK